MYKLMHSFKLSKKKRWYDAEPSVLCHMSGRRTNKNQGRSLIIFLGIVKYFQQIRLQRSLDFLNRNILLPLFMCEIQT